MAYIKVTVDEETVLDGESGTWEAKTPEFLTKQIESFSANPNTTPPSPWMRALMLIIAEAIMTNSYTEVDVKTTGSGWILETKYAIELGS